MHLDRLARRKEAEKLRDYFEVQLMFAETVARRMSSAVSDACLTFTNLHRRFGLGRIESGIPSPGWARYANELDRAPSTASRLESALALFIESQPRESASRKFGCFSCETIEREKVVRIHFGNYDSTGDCGPLALTKVERRLSELREMFGFIRANHPHARTVRGGSWLYNTNAYRRLFPPNYVASVFEPERVRLDGTSSWGQLLDFRGVVRPAVRQAVLDNIETVDIATPWKAFPLRALGVQCAIENFYRFYDC